VTVKLNRLETHDRLQHLKKDQSANIFQGCEDCLKKNPDSLAIQEKSPYLYIFAHPRTADDGITKRMLWQPRLSKPTPQTNSYLFRALSNTDVIEVIWMIPPREHWEQYKAGNVTDSNICRWSIDVFQKNRELLQQPHAEDMPEEQARMIMLSIVNEKRQQLRMEKLYREKMDSAFSP